MKRLDPSLLAIVIALSLHAQTGFCATYSAATTSANQPPAVFSFLDSRAVNPYPLGFGPGLTPPTADQAEIMFFGYDYQWKLSRAIGGASSDPAGKQLQKWEKQYNAMDKTDITALEGLRKQIAAVLDGTAKPDFPPLNADGKTPYNGPTNQVYTKVDPPPAWTEVIVEDQAAKDAAAAKAIADAKAKEPPPPPKTVADCGIYASMAGKGSPCYDIGVKAGLIIEKDKPTYSPSLPDSGSASPAAAAASSSKNMPPPPPPPAANQ